MSTALFEPFQLGDLSLANRMVMAPMTRNRADRDGQATPAMVTYYRQRASAGLIITESSPVSMQGVGYPHTPGIHTQQQVQRWRGVTGAVHAAGGRIFIQLQHCGRISHPSLLPRRAIPVAPSALRPDGQALTHAGMQAFLTPRALETREMAGIVAQFRQAAESAKAAGFDGVEVHAANGYLIDQFLRDGSNRRTDTYGGTPSNRMRLLNEVLDALADVWPAHRVGVRFSPENGFNAMADSDPQGHFEYFAGELRPRGLAYLHVLEGDMMSRARAVDYRALRSLFGGTYIANRGYDLPRAREAVGRDAGTLVAFGTPFIANPDLVRRYREGLPLNAADRSTFYGGGTAGFTDYAFYGEEVQAA
jgi:N-ethylmaleimide reductase